MPKMPKTSKLPEMRPKAAQWSFTIPSFSSDAINHLTGLKNDDTVSYAAHAIIDDDTGNRYIQGCVKLHMQFRLVTLHRLIGKSGICTTCLRANDILMDIQMNHGFQEFGKDDRSEKFRQRVAELRKEVDTGATVCTLMGKFPDVCARNPFAATKHVEKAMEKSIPVPEQVNLSLSEDDWVKAGGPTGLPWKAHQAWKQGEVHQPSHEEWVTRNNAFARTSGMARNAFTEWSKNHNLFNLRGPNGQLLLGSNGQLL